MTEGYGDGRMALVGGAWNVPATEQLEQRVAAIEQLLVALHASFERIEAGMVELLTEIRELG